jgi:transcriptional regulator with XRE-family HTH domain
MDLREVFARNLRHGRHHKGLSQEELADAAEINRTYLSKLETAQTYAGLEIIGKLAKVLQVEPHELLLRPSRRPSKK